MNSKPCLLLYCQHSVGIGHLTRSMAVAAALTRQFRVVFLNGGRMPQHFLLPTNVEVIDLPPIGMDDGHTLVSRDGSVAVEHAKAQRSARVLDLYHTLQPKVLLIEMFPFGRKKFAFELLPLLKAARRQPKRPLVLCSVRDILVQDRPDQQVHDDRAAWLCNRYFDAVLVHADPKLARLSESFRPRKPLAIATHYTGFVVRESERSSPTQRRQHILVSAGGGIVGGELFRTALRAHAQSGARHGRPMRIIAGPFLPEDEWISLRQQAARCQRVQLIRSVPDMTQEMQAAAISVSQCGYNTAMDILTTHVPALVIPYSEGRENEQSNRAQRLQNLQLLRCLPAHALQATRLQDEINATLSFAPNKSGLMLNGADETARVVERLLAASLSGSHRSVRDVEAQHVA